MEKNKPLLASVAAPLLSRNPLSWLAIFGPGAIIASLTIGTGELIFSTRGGVLFGYRILFLFVLISILKWGLVFAMSRHMVLSGVHPCQRMLELPGPRGWLPLMLLMLAAICIPVWVCFHCGVLGNLTSWVTNTHDHLNGAVDYLWGAVFLTGVLILSLTGGYSVLERVQLAIVGALLFCAAITLVLYQPDWFELLKGALVPQTYQYPEWLDRLYPDVSRQPIWVEITRYVGVIGGGGFDYLAYVSFVRDKRWGLAGVAEATPAQLEQIAGQPTHAVRSWVRAPLIDCTVSFLVIVAFSAVFVASGVVVLGPNHQLPTQDNLLYLQSTLVTSIHSWLLPVYVLGAYLTMVGTLYGTIEVGHVIAREIIFSFRPQLVEHHARKLKVIAVLWCAAGAYGVLMWLFYHAVGGGENQPRLLLALLTPANLFTGVLLCGLLCLLTPWMDIRFFPKLLRLPAWLLLLNVAAGVCFLALGTKGYWDNHQPEGPWLASRWFAVGGIVMVAAVSFLVAAVIRVRKRHG